MKRESPVKVVIKSLGLVFGDIGTGPIYTFTVIFLLTKPVETNIIGPLCRFDFSRIILITLTVFEQSGMYV